MDPKDFASTYTHNSTVQLGLGSYYYYNYNNNYNHYVWPLASAHTELLYS